MRRLLLILTLLAVPIQGGNIRPLTEGTLAEPRSDLALAAAPMPTATGVILRRVSPLEPLLSHDAGCFVSWRFDSAAATWCGAPAQLTSGEQGSNDSLQAQSVRWQI